MGFLDLHSFCCGVAPLRVGCKIIALATTVFSFAVLAVGVSYNDQLISCAAYFLLLFAILLIYGVLERVKILLLAFLFLRAITAALELADIMRSLGMGIKDSRGSIRVMLETLDLGMTIYFWLVVFSFFVKPDSYQLPMREDPRHRGRHNGGIHGSHSSLFPNVPHYPPVPDEEPMSAHSASAAISRSRRASTIALNAATSAAGSSSPPTSAGAGAAAHHRRREDSASSPYNLIHQGRGSGGQASPSTSSGDVFTYSGMSKATPLSPHHSSPRSPRSPRHSVTDMTALGPVSTSPPSSSLMSPVASVAHLQQYRSSSVSSAGGAPGARSRISSVSAQQQQQQQQQQQKLPLSRPRPHPRAENLKYHASPSGNPFL